jgi:methionyl-tRNA formyltransferase
VATLDGIADGSLHPQPQSADGVSHAPKLTVADAEIRFDQPARAIDRRIRACTPEPGAWVRFRDGRLKLGPVTVLGPADAGPVLRPGELASDRDGVLVGTATAPVLLGSVQPAGKRPMPAAGWANGARLTAGDHLGE